MFGFRYFCTSYFCNGLFWHINLSKFSLWLKLCLHTALCVRQKLFMYIALCVRKAINMLLCVRNDVNMLVFMWSSFVYMLLFMWSRHLVYMLFTSTWCSLFKSQILVYLGHKLATWPVLYSKCSLWEDKAIHVILIHTQFSGQVSDVCRVGEGGGYWKRGMK